MAIRWRVTPPAAPHTHSSAPPPKGIKANDCYGKNTRPSSFGQFRPFPRWPLCPMNRTSPSGQIQSSTNHRRRALLPAHESTLGIRLHSAHLASRSGAKSSATTAASQDALKRPPRVPGVRNTSPRRGCAKTRSGDPQARSRGEFWPRWRAMGVDRRSRLGTIEDSPPQPVALAQLAA